MFLFDEVFYLKYLQSEFFNTLFGFRNFHKIGFAISTYPTFMNYGEAFDIPDDAKEIPVTNGLYKPTLEEYNLQYINLVKKRIKTYAKKDIDEVISIDTLELLILIVNGNPRILLQIIDYIWRSNGQKKIVNSSINQNIIEECANSWYIEFLNKQACRYKTSIDKANKFLKIITDRLKEYNSRNENSTIYVLLDNTIITKYSETIDLLIYSRILNKDRIGSFGGSTGKKGVVYSLTPLIGWYFGIFDKKQTNSLMKKIKHCIEKDNKIQFSSCNTFDNSISESFQITCPRLSDSLCTNPECAGMFSEKWRVCPYNSLNLEIIRKTSSEISIDVLQISAKLKERLNSFNITTIHDILVSGKVGLMNIPYIKDVRATSLYDLAKEYIDDNL